MNFMRVRPLAAILLLILMTASAVWARTYHALTVKIPFKFSVGKRTFRAGEYQFISVGTGLWAVRDARERVIAMLTTRPALTPASQDQEHSHLSFRKNKKHIELAAITMDDARQEILGEEATGNTPPPAITPAELFTTPANIVPVR